MSASTILTRLKEAGVKIAVSDGQLKLKGPKSALSEDVLSELRAIKAELINVLSATETASKPDVSSVIAEWRAAIAAVHPDLPDIVKLKTASLRFLASPDAVAAVENDWNAVSLFGMHEGEAPKERLDCWGLVLFIAWGVHAHAAHEFDQKVCAIRTGTGAVLRQRKFRPNYDEAVPWWLHPHLQADGGQP